MGVRATRCLSDDECARLRRRVQFADHRCPNSPFAWERSMELSINGHSVQVSAGDDTPLLWVLRDHLGMTGTKFGCGLALCGACTVLVDGEAVRACVLPVSTLGGKQITTIEGVGAT